ncbi:MAG: HD domain-containing protein [Paludibacteraceae bacterium]|nr:HD domain-containing protein [Paludibacteraceae bacterium]
MNDYLSLIDKYYAEQPELKALLLHHSRQVADKALAICAAHPEWQVDKQFVEEAAMLHDIGIIFCDAPGILCHGTEPYIRHGLIGAELLRKEGFPKHARVAERHTGSGLSAKEIEEQQLPLPMQDYLPESLEERIICYADKFFSKSHPEREENSGNIRRKMEKFGTESLQRWLQLEYEMTAKHNQANSIIIH